MLQDVLIKYDTELKTFENWINSQPKLPKNINRFLLLRFLKIHDFDVVKSQDLLLYYFKIRKKYPLFFKQRDLFSKEFQQVFSYFQMFEMQPRTQMNHKVTIFRLIEENPESFVISDLFRLSLAGLDAKFVTEDQNSPHDGEILINDMKNFGLKHLMPSLASPIMIKNLLKYVQNAAPMKLVEIHSINYPPVFLKLVNFVKPLMNKEVADSLYFHPSFDSLQDKVPKECLPEEFGGSAGKSDNLNREWTEFFMSKRDYILNDDNWKLED